MLPNFILIGSERWVSRFGDVLMEEYRRGSQFAEGVCIIIKQFRPWPAPQRSLKLKGTYKDDQAAAVGESLRTLGYLRLAEKTGL